MNSFRFVIVGIALLTAAAVMAGPLSSPASAQSYEVSIDVIQESGGWFLFQPLQNAPLIHDVIVTGAITVIVPPSLPDAITLVLIANDTGIFSTQAALIPTTAMPGDVVNLTPAAHFTFVEGVFTVVVSSAQLGVELFRQVYPVPDYDVSVGISSTLGEVGTQFVVETRIDLGNYSIVDSTFDIEYTLDGQTARESESVFLIDATGFTFAGLPFPRNDNYLEWRTTHAFTLDPGLHTLEVRVFDRSIAAADAPRAAEVHSASFTINVSDQVMDLQESTEGRLDAIETETQGLTERTGLIEATTAITSPLAWLSIAAIALSTIALLVQFGILKFARRRRGPGDEQE